MGEVDRYRLKLVHDRTGILKGMAVTLRNFVGSYFEKDRLITVQYPEEREPLPENYRNFPFLIYDTDDAEAGLRCVACKICEKECPPQCIYIVKSEDKKPDYMGKPQFYPADLRYRHLRLHELPDLRRGLSVRSDQDGQGIRAKSARALRRAVVAKGRAGQVEHLLSQHSSDRGSRSRREAGRSGRGSSKKEGFRRCRSSSSSSYCRNNVTACWRIGTC